MRIHISYESDHIFDELECSIKNSLSAFGFRCTDSGLGMGNRDLCFSDEIKPPSKIVYLNAGEQK
jgi:hypothetical protein